MCFLSLLNLILERYSKTNVFFRASTYINYIDPDDMVVRMNLTDKFRGAYLLERKSIAADHKPFSFPQGKNEVRESNNT